MTVELELEDVLELIEAARAHGAAVFVTRDEDGDRVWLKVNSRKPGRPRKRAGAALDPPLVNSAHDGRAGSLEGK